MHIDVINASGSTGIGEPASPFPNYNDVNCKMVLYNSDKLIFRIRINRNLQLLKKKKNKNVLETLDQSDEIYLLRNLQDELLDNMILRGIKNINKVTLRKISDNFEEVDTKLRKLIHLTCLKTWTIGNV